MDKGVVVGGGTFVFPSHYPMTHTSRKRCYAGDMDRWVKRKVEVDG